MTDRLRLRKDSIAWREVDGEVVALGLASSTYFGTNTAGTLLWQLLADGTTRDALADALVSRFGITRDRAQVDVNAFVDDLLARDLLEP